MERGRPGRIIAPAKHEYRPLRTPMERGRPGRTKG